MDEKNRARLKALEALETGRHEAQSEPPPTSETHTIRSGEIRPIADLDPDARRYFDAIADFLDERGLLEVVDVLILTLLAKNLTLWIDLSNRISSADDIVQTFENGTSNISGIQTAKDRIEGQVLKLSAKLGLSPMDRAKLFGAATSAAQLNQNQTSGDELDRFLSD